MEDSTGLPPGPWRWGECPSWEWEAAQGAGVEDRAGGLEGVNSVQGLSESEAPQAVVEIPCARRVVTQKRETALFGPGDGGGWSQGADAWPGGAGQGVETKEAWLLALLGTLGKEEGGLARTGHTMRCPWALTDT